MDNRIRAFREARGQSLEELAAETGTTNQQISLLETGKRRLTVEWLFRLSKALTCHPWELVAESLPQPMRSQDIRLLERFRGLAEPQQDALLQFLETLPLSSPRRHKVIPSK